MARSQLGEKTIASEETGSSEKRRQAILAAATGVFLRCGYLGASMDEIASIAQVSKQTVYKQFSSKEALFVGVVRGMTDRAGDVVHKDVPEIADGEKLSEYLQTYALRQLTVVLTPPIMQLRRLVIGEVSRFPELAQVLYERGPQRAMTIFAAILEQFGNRGLLKIEDPKTAASHFNWLVMSEPLNRAMLLGDEAIPKPAALRRHVAESVRVFLAAYESKK